MRRRRTARWTVDPIDRHPEIELDIDEILAELDPGMLALRGDRP